MSSPAEVLEAQLARLRSDEFLVTKARALLDLTPAERLRMFADLCESGAFFVARVPEEVQARVRGIEERPLPPDATAALRRLYGGAR